MGSYFHAVAVDYDGTLAREGQPAPGAMDAVGRVRAAGFKVVLVTGRILTDLRNTFPGVDRHFDAIVAENGAVVSMSNGTRLLTPAVEPALEYELRSHGVPVHRGDVLLATLATHDELVAGVIDRLGLECQIVRNRGALMILPAGINKGSGLKEALSDLGISPHNTVGIGDAENDHSLLDACEIGVAVGDAVASLRARADIILPGEDGSAVAAFLGGPLLDGLPGTRSKRRTLTLGTYDDGTDATLPASRTTIAIHGASGTGKSFLAGLVAEQLIRLDYTVCIIDLEGDHLGIGGLHGVVSLGGREDLPSPAQVDRFIRQGFTSVVLDLSLQPPEVKRRYALATLGELRRTRAAVGLPHWIIIDEAHVPIASGIDHWTRTPDESGVCYITYRPDLLANEVQRDAEFVIIAHHDHRATLRETGDGPERRFAAAERITAHVRHWHKYIEGQLPVERRFYFRDHRGLTGHSAGNLLEFRDAIRSASADTLRHHGSHGDFSRWLTTVCSASAIVTATRAAELALSATPSADALEQIRDKMVRALDGKASTPPCSVGAERSSEASVQPSPRDLPNGNAHA